jgi:protein-S-isoprenylcysteine O-methyltransferase Ste14
VKGKLLVAAQMLLLGVLAASAWWADAWQTPTWTRALGLVVAASGAVLCFAAFPQLGRALTPLPEPREDAELMTSGLYARMRHPIYTGVLAVAWGWTVMFPSVFTAAAAVALTGLLAFKARYEEGLLRGRFSGYADYAARTPRFVPRPW